MHTCLAETLALSDSYIFLPCINFVRYLPHVLAYKPTVFWRNFDVKSVGLAYIRAMPHSRSEHSGSMLRLRDAHSVCVPHTAWTISRPLKLHKCVGE